jgi:hypothetical protein
VLGLLLRAWAVVVAAAAGARGAALVLLLLAGALQLVLGALLRPALLPLPPAAAYNTVRSQMLVRASGDTTQLMCLGVLVCTTCSTLQQEANHDLGWATVRSMQVIQTQSNLTYALLPYLSLLRQLSFLRYFSFLLVSHLALVSTAADVALPNKMLPSRVCPCKLG